MIRHLIPRVEWAGWCGSALTRNPKARSPLVHDDVNGRVLCIQWLGLMVEIAFGRVS